MNKVVLPAIVADMDGVVVRGHNSGQISGADVTLKRLFTKIGSPPKHLPFVFLTNGGFKTEKNKAEHVSKQIYGPDSNENLLKKEHIIMCHTILQDESILGRYADKYVLVDSMSD